LLVVVVAVEAAFVYLLVCFVCLFVVTHTQVSHEVVVDVGVIFNFFWRFYSFFVCTRTAERAAEEEERSK